MTTEMVGEVVPVAENVAVLESMTAQQREVAVTSMLGQARDWLAHAKEATEPKRIAEFKAQMATIAEATKQLNLSKDIQLDALEMVRRGERGVSTAVTEAQQAGEVERRTETVNRGKHVVLGEYDVPQKPSPRSFYANSQEWTDANIEAAASPEEFDEAITAAKSEGNLSRVNVVRKLTTKAKQPDQPTRLKLPESERVEQITELTKRARSVAQIAAEIGITEEHVRVIANRNNIETVDKRLGHGSIRNPKSAEVAGRIISGLETTAEISIPLVHITDLDPAQCKDWASSLAASIRSLNRFRRQLEGRAQS